MYTFQCIHSDTTVITNTLVNHIHLNLHSIPSHVDNPEILNRYEEMIAQRTALDEALVQLNMEYQQYEANVEFRKGDWLTQVGVMSLER